MKVAIISDTHAYLDPRIADMIRQCDIAVHAGDICGKHILEAMQPKTGKVYAVAGNNDFHADYDGLAAELTLDLPHGKLAVEHGHRHGMHKPDHASLRKAHPEAKMIVYGHTHTMLQDRDARPWIVNPGAAGQTRTRGGPSCLVLDCSTPEWQVTEYRFSEEMAA